VDIDFFILKKKEKDCVLFSRHCMGSKVIPVSPDSSCHTPGPAGLLSPASAHSSSDHPVTERRETVHLSAVGKYN